MEPTERALGESRILCVDDDPFSLEFISDILARQGARVTTCDSAEEAIAVLENERFDVVVSDLSMPGLEGYDLVHALREMEDRDSSRVATPTIAVSGDALRSSRKRRYADFQVYMPKPINKVHLVYVVERLLEADSEAVKFGSLGSWEAEQATRSAGIATADASAATAAASNAAVAAANATAAAVEATASATKARIAAAEAETRASKASAKAPPLPVAEGNRS